MKIIKTIMIAAMIIFLKNFKYDTYILYSNDMLKNWLIQILNIVDLT
jgi:hypothetical protein